jgi:Zn-dependent protease
MPGPAWLNGDDLVFAELLFSDPARFVAWVGVVAFSVCVHETAHAWTAWLEGDDTAVRNGYGSLDPRRLMGWPALLALALFGIAWGSVPVIPSRFRHPWSDALVAFAGPATNLLLAVVCGLAYTLTLKLAPGAEPLVLVFRAGLEANCLLGVLNLLPVPPFDGWAIATFLVPPLRRVAAEQVNILGWVLLTVLLFTPASRIVYGTADVIANHIHAAAQALIG